MRSRATTVHGASAPSKLIRERWALCPQVQPVASLSTYSQWVHTPSACVSAHTAHTSPTENIALLQPQTALVTSFCSPLWLSRKKGTENYLWIHTAWYTTLLSGSCHSVPLCSVAGSCTHEIPASTAPIQQPVQSPSHTKRQTDGQTDIHTHTHRISLATGLKPLV